MTFAQAKPRAIAVFTRAGVKGTVRSRAPVASKIALASAAGDRRGGRLARARAAASFGRSTMSISISGTSGKVRIG